MKKIILFLFALTPMVVLAQVGSYSIKGTFANTEKNGKVFLSYNAKGNTNKDSAVVSGGKFELNGQVSSAYRAYLEFVPGIPASGLRNAKKDIKLFYIEPENIIFKMQDSLKNAVVSGSQATSDELKLRDILAPVSAQIFKGRVRYSKIDKAAANADSLKKSIENELVALAKTRTLLISKFIEDNPDSYLSLWAIRDIAGAYLDGEDAPILYEKISPRIKNTPDGKEFASILKGVDRTREGRVAPGFVQPDTAGNLVKLSDFKGKYVLVDFWASWCHPCREENPRVLKAYNKYKSKDFTVIGISIDQQKMRSLWLKAIKDDGMPWTQLIDPSGDPKGAAGVYGVKAIPSNFLIGPDGKIIARNLRGGDLERKLGELLD